MSLKTWITSSLERNFPHTPARRTGRLKLEIAKNEHFSFQIALRANVERQKVQVSISAPKGCKAQIRRVGYVPVRHQNRYVVSGSQDIDGVLPGFVPDPLFEEDGMSLPKNETHSFWVTIRPGRSVRAGKHVVRVRVKHEGGKTQEHAIDLRIHSLALKKRKDFSVTNWFYLDALIDWYKTDLFDKRFWEIVPRYLKNLSEHGQDTVVVPVFTLSLDGVKRPSQLLRVKCVSKDCYTFDWRDVKRYVDTAKKSGITKFEWGHLFTQWGVKYALRIYEGQGRDEKLLWPAKTGATSKTYRAFLTQFLPEFERFLRKEKLMKCSYFHVSDEPGVEALGNYRKARALLKELAPWMKVMDALSAIEFAREGVTDMPVASISKVLKFVKEGIPSWCYYCCGPRDLFLNRLLDTPLPKIAMHGMLFYRWPLEGFLHWGYNYWCKAQTNELLDPFIHQDGMHWEAGWPAGDPFEVYPGPEGPIDSIRWEIFGESLQDYRLLQTVGLSPEDSLLSPLKSFEDFPKMAKWRLGLRKKLFKLGAKKK